MVAGTSLIVPSGAISTTTFTPDLVTAANARCKSDCLNLDARRLPRLGDMAARASDDWAGPYDVHDPEQSDNASVTGLLACDGMRFKVAIVASTTDSWRWQEKLSPIESQRQFRSGVNPKKPAWDAKRHSAHGCFHQCAALPVLTLTPKCAS